MQIIRNNDVPVKKLEFSSGNELRKYYLPGREPIEIIETFMSVGVRETPHSHSAIREAALVLEGSIVVAEIAGGKRYEQKLEKGDFVVFDPSSCHVVENNSTSEARILSFKFLGKEKDAILFATDKECCNVANVSEVDPRFECYVRTYTHLDRLEWQMPVFLAAVSAFLIPCIVKLLRMEQTEIIKVLLPATVFLAGVFYALSSYAMCRIQKNRFWVGKELGNMEGKGYFYNRSQRKEWVWSASRMFILFFATLAALFFVFTIMLIKKAWLSPGCN